MTLASNLLLNRRDNLLKLSHRDVPDKDSARLRNASLTKKELCSSKVLSEVEQNFIQWTQINRESVYKKQRTGNYGSHFLIRRKIPCKTDTRMLLFRIFVPNLNRVTQIRGKPALTDPVEALAEGLGAGGSNCTEVSTQTKYPGALESVGKPQSASEGSSCFKARLLSSKNQKQLLISSKTESFAGGGSTNGSEKGSHSHLKQELSDFTVVCFWFQNQKTNGVQ